MLESAIQTAEMCDVVTPLYHVIYADTVIPVVRSYDKSLSASLCTLS